MTHRKKLEYWTETHRVVGDEVKVTTCCCSSPGASRRTCADSRGNKTPCRCFCHSDQVKPQPTGPSPEYRKLPAIPMIGGPHDGDHAEIEVLVLSGWIGLPLRVLKRGEHVYLLRADHAAWKYGGKMESA